MTDPVAKKKWVDGRGWVLESELTLEDVEKIEKHYQRIEKNMQQPSDLQVKRKRPNGTGR